MVAGVSGFAEYVLRAVGARAFLEIVGSSAAATPHLRLKGLRAATTSLTAILNGEFKLSGAFDTIITYHSTDDIDGDDLAALFNDIKSAGINNIAMHVSYYSSLATPHYRPRYWWESKLIECGFRKHPRYFDILSYADLEFEGEGGMILMQRVPQLSLERYPYEKLMAERALHMDMARESGRRSEGHMVRYQHAASLIRPGDVVVDVACGLGYGSATLASSSQASCVMGIDLDDFAIDYAKINYQNERLQFEIGSATDLRNIADNSVDFFTSFETLEHVTDPGLVIKEALRVLKPSGRVMVSVPNLWVDEAGNDPNPYHLQVYDRQRLVRELSEHFLVDQVFAQTAGGGFKCHGAARKIWEITSAPTNPEESEDVEWLLATAMKDPVSHHHVRYHETSFPDYCDRVGYNVLAIERDYDNPWLYKSLLSIPWRLRSADALKQLATNVSSNEPPTIDGAAALAVLGYGLLHNGNESQRAEFLSKLDDAVEKLPGSPIGIRWSVSLFYLKAQFSLSDGDMEAAREALEKVTQFDAGEFSPLLFIKTCSAWFTLGVMALQGNDRSKARNCWKQGLLTTKSALAADWLNVLGSVDAPLGFGLPEISLLADIGSRCAFAIDGIAAEGADDGLLYALISSDWTSLRGLQELEKNDLQEVAEQRLLEIRRLREERQELYDTAEERLAETHRLGRERQELYDIAEERLVELQQLKHEREELLSLAETRLKIIHDKEKLLYRGNYSTNE